MRAKPLLVASVIAMSLVAAHPGGATTSSAAPLLNISTRGYVQTGDRALIGGFIVGGSVSKRVLLRGIGPSLAAAGLSDVLADPSLELRDKDGNLVLANDNWRDTQPAEIEVTGLAPGDTREAAIVADLFAPDRYTAVLRGNNNGIGIGLIEMYDLTPNSGSLLANISTRGFGDTGDRAMIAGLIVGKSDKPARVIARALGPSLADAGVKDSLPDPTLELRARDGSPLAANDNWKQSLAIGH